MLEGVPKSYQTGERYSITVRLNGTDEMRVAGFQMATRHLDGSRQGEQAGILEAIDDQVEVTRAIPDEIQYAHHSAIGSQVDSSEEMSWQVIWTAPSDPVSGPVIFHVAANAGNGDDSELGDRVFFGAWTSGANAK